MSEKSHPVAPWATGNAVVPCPTCAAPMPAGMPGRSLVRCSSCGAVATVPELPPELPAVETPSPGVALHLTRDQAFAVLRAAERGHAHLEAIAHSPSESRLMADALAAIREALTAGRPTADDGPLPSATRP